MGIEKFNQAFDKLMDAPKQKLRYPGESDAIF